MVSRFQSVCSDEDESKRHKLFDTVGENCITAIHFLLFLRLVSSPNREERFFFAARGREKSRRMEIGGEGGRGAERNSMNLNETR